MKNTVISIIAAIFLVLATVHAADVDVDQTSVKFYAYGEGLDTSRTIIVSNNLTTAVTLKLAGQLTFRSDSNEKLNLTTQTITVNAKSNYSIDMKVDSTDLSDAPLGLYTGNLNVVNTTNNVTLKTVPVEVTVPGIKLTKITSSDSKLERGQKFNITIDYKNLGKNGYLDDMTVVELSVTDRRGDVMSDVNEDSLEVTDEEVDRLKYGSSDKYVAEFSMPYDLDGSSVTVHAIVRGCNEDYSNECFESELNKTISIDDIDDKVEIVRASLSPSTLDCGQGRAKLQVEVRNLGDRKEYLRLLLTNQQNGVEKVLNNNEEIDLGNDYSDESDYIVTHEENVELGTLKAGVNTFLLTVDIGEKNPVTKELTVTSLSCAPVAPVVNTTTTVPEVVVVPTTNNPVTTATAVPAFQGTNTPYVTLKDVSGFSLDSSWMIPTIIGVGGLIIGIAVALLIMPRA